MRQARKGPGPGAVCLLHTSAPSNYIIIPKNISFSYQKVNVTLAGTLCVCLPLHPHHLELCAQIAGAQKCL